MDVPVSIGVLLAAGVSIAELLRSGPHAYFDAAITLLFFLLVGRYLDLRARGFARRAAQRLVAFTVRPVSVLTAEEYGRASWRERGGQYVLVPVVALSFKNKNIKTIFTVK